MARNRRAVAADPGSPKTPAMFCGHFLSNRSAQRQDEGPAPPPLRVAARPPPKWWPRQWPARGVSRCGTFVPLPDLQSGFGAGFEPATLGLQDRCSTHLSYPRGDVPESNRRPRSDELRALPLSQRHGGNILLRHRAYATAQPRAPDGTPARTAGHRSMDASHWRLLPIANSVARSPVATRARHQDTAQSAWLLSSYLGRERRRRDVHCCPHDQTTLALLQPQRCADSPCRTRPDAKKNPENHAKNRLTPFANAQNKKPPDLVRGHSRSSEIGTTDLRNDEGSVDQAATGKHAFGQPRALARIAVAIRGPCIGNVAEGHVHEEKS